MADDDDKDQAEQPVVAPESNAQANDPQPDDEQPKENPTSGVQSSDDLR